MANTRDVIYSGVDELETVDEPKFFPKYTPVGRQSPFVKPLTTIRSNEKHHGRWKVLATYGKRTTAASAKNRLVKDHPDMKFDLSQGESDETLLIVRYSPKHQAS